MSDRGQLGLDLIDVIPNAGASLNRSLDWRDQLEIDDSSPEIGELASTISSDEMTMFLREEHHGARGRPWALGSYYDTYLRGRGVGAGDRLLDFGCGAGRLGVLLLERLDAGSYVGIDAHLLSLKAFAGYEISLRNLHGKDPALIWGGVESLRFFQPGYSVVLDLFTSPRLPEPARRVFFEEARRLLDPGGRLIALAPAGDFVQVALDAGFVITHKHVQDIPLFWPLGRKKRVNSWIEYSVRA